MLQKAFGLLQAISFKGGESLWTRLLFCLSLVLLLSKWLLALMAGVFVLFHGGGGDVGYAESAKLREKCIQLTEEGFIAISVEYRRGWTDDGFDVNDPNRGFVIDDCSIYDRQEEAGRLSIDDARLALEWIMDSIPAASKGVYLEGTSFGGSLVAYCSIMDPGAAAYNLKGAIVGYGGINSGDPIVSPDVCPMLFIGGAGDPLVPWFHGPYFCGSNICGYGGGHLHELVDAAGGLSWSIDTTNRGHSYGAVEWTSGQQFALLRQMLELIAAGNWLTNRETFLLANEMDLPPQSSNKSAAIAAWNNRCSTRPISLCAMSLCTP